MTLDLQPMLANAHSYLLLSKTPRFASKCRGCVEATEMGGPSQICNDKITYKNNVD